MLCDARIRSRLPPTTRAAANMRVVGYLGYAHGGQEKLSKRTDTIMAPLPSSATAIPTKVFSLLNGQGNRKWEESLCYAAFAVWFTHNELPGSAAWCLKHSDEERCKAIAIFKHLAERRIEQGDVKGSGGGGGGTTGGGGGGTSTEGQRQQLEVQEPPTASKTFEWVTQPNVYLEVAHKKCEYQDPIHIWKTALGCARKTSTQFFEALAVAREHNDFVSEEYILHHLVPGQFKEEKALEEILENALLVTKRSPDLYFELDKAMSDKGH